MSKNLDPTGRKPPPQPKVRTLADNNQKGRTKQLPRTGRSPWSRRGR